MSGIFVNFILATAGIVMVLAAASDAMRFRIPNWASLSLLLLFPVYVVFAPVTVAWEKHLLVFAIILAVGYLIFLKNWAGAGDIKLLSVIGLWAGPTYALTFLFVTALAGGLLAIGIATLAVIRQYLLPHDSKETAVPLTKTPLPYGIAIALGGLCTLALLSHPDLLAAKV